MHPAIIVPSHGAVGTGALIASDRALMETIASRAAALKAQGKSVDETASTIQSELTAASPPRYAPPTMRSSSRTAIILRLPLTDAIA